MGALVFRAVYLLPRLVYAMGLPDAWVEVTAFPVPRRVLRVLARCYRNVHG